MNSDASPLAPVLERVYATLAALTLVVDEPGKYFSAPAVCHGLQGARLWDPDTDGHISPEKVSGFLHALCDEGRVARAEVLAHWPEQRGHPTYGYRALF